MSSHVLIVDDEAPVRKLLDVALSGEGFAVASAADADEAFALVSTFRPVLAVVDINLPGMSGMELCRQLSTEHGVEVILITGDDDSYAYEDAARSGACDFLPKPIRIRELVLRIERALSARAIRMERDATVSELRYLSITDELTGLFNARHFSEKLESELARSGRYGHNVSLLLLDLDHFKQVNDQYGHPEGDLVLQHVGRAILESIRDPDTAYRYGGEEFAVILPETVKDDAIRVAERLRVAIARDRGDSTETPHPSVTTSVGVALWSKGEDPASLLRRADAAMYDAKQNGRDRISLASNR